MGVDPLTASAGAPAPELVPTPTKAAPEVLGKAAHATDSACVESEGANSPEAAEDGVYTSLRDLGDDFFSDPDGSSPFGIPMSMWEQLAGLFDDENYTPPPGMDAAAADGGHDAAPAAPKVDVGEPPGGLGPGFGAGHLDTTTMFDAGVAVDDWMFATTGSPAASAAEMDAIEMQANARITAMLSGKEHPMPTSRVAAMRDALEAVLLHDDESMAQLRACRDARADTQLPSAYVALEFGQPWEVALEESFRSVLKLHGLDDAYNDVCQSNDAGAKGAGSTAQAGGQAGKSTLYTRALALCVISLRDRMAAALAEFDATIEEQAARLEALRSDGDSALMPLPSAHTGFGVDTDGQMHQAWMAEVTATAAEVPREVMPDRMADVFAASTQSLIGATMRAKLTSRLDARLRSRVAAMHRMALRAFAKAAAEVVAPETHPDAPPCLRKASAMAPPPSMPASAKGGDTSAADVLRSAPPALRRAGKPTPHSRALLKAWMHAHVFPSASHPHGPFPSPQEKEALADETGLSVNQVNDWFVNARARWWKPLVEGMHSGLVSHLADPLAGVTDPLPCVPERGEEEAAAEQTPAGRGMHPRRQRSMSRTSMGVFDVLARGGKAPVRRRASSLGGGSESRRSSGSAVDVGQLVDELGLGDGSL